MIIVKRVPMGGADKIENLLEDSYLDLQSQIDNFTNNGSGWTLNRVITFCIDIVKFCPFERSCYFDLSPRLKAKQAIMNIKNRDNECFRWALRAWTFPVQQGGHSGRPRKNTSEDGFDFSGTDFPEKIGFYGCMQGSNQRAWKELTLCL